MGFFDSFSTGVSNFFGNVSSGLGDFFGSPVVAPFTNIALSRGVEQFADLIGLRPSTGGDPTRSVTGAPRGFPTGQLGIPRIPQIPQPGSLSIPRPDQILSPEGLSEELAFFQPGGPGAPVRRLTGSLDPRERSPLRTLLPGSPAPVRPSFALPPPSVPATQPFGVMPGSRFAPLPGGPEMAAFPTTRFATFQPSAFDVATARQVGLPSLLRQAPAFLGGIIGGEALDLAFAGSGGGTPMFRPTMAGARAQFFRAQNPATGQDTWFRPAGRPLLWSGDLSACKRVNKVAKRARRKR